MKKFYWIASLLLVGCLTALYVRYERTHRKLLIVGAARSGTQFIAHALRAQGMRIGHERMGGHGTCSWDLAAASDAGRWKTRRGKFQFAHVFHQVRHPLRVISSVYITEDRDSWNYIISQTPEIQATDPHLVKCAKYWYYWNLKAAELAEWRYRVEEIDDVWEEFGEKLGKRFDRRVVQQVPKDTHTKGIPRKEFTWEDLRAELDPELLQNIVSLAKEYGYSVPEIAHR